uniref:G-protein coupled receptors family 3 profile domain-containing protein n=1 Tax=Minutocellus polymorphus TaxID=265543 RepID=A0A7S0AKY8_9STRA
MICVGFSVAFASILSKTLRINKIFHNPSIRRIKITARDVAKPIFASLALNVLVLSLWTALSPLHWSREVTAVDEFNRAVTSNGICTSEGFLPYVIILVVGNVGLLALALYQVYNARSLSTEFAESEYIFKALFIAVLVCFVGIPVMIIVEGEPRAYFFLLSSIIFVLCSALLLFMFVPKILFHFNPDKGKQKDAVRQFVSKKYSTGPSSTVDQQGVSYHRKASASSVASWASTGGGETGVSSSPPQEPSDDINKENAELKKTIETLNARVESLVKEQERRGESSVILVPEEKV